MKGPMRQRADHHTSRGAYRRHQRGADQAVDLGHTADDEEATPLTAKLGGKWGRAEVFRAAQHGRRHVLTTWSTTAAAMQQRRHLGVYEHRGILRHSSEQPGDPK